jgi:hypothetical protein
VASMCKLYNEATLMWKIVGECAFPNEGRCGGQSIVGEKHEELAKAIKDRTLRLDFTSNRVRPCTPPLLIPSVAGIVQWGRLSLEEGQG